MVALAEMIATVVVSLAAAAVSLEVPRKVQDSQQCKVRHVSMVAMYMEDG